MYLSVFFHSRHAVTWHCLFAHFSYLSDYGRQTDKHPPNIILRQPSCERGTAPLLLCCHGVRLWRTTWNARTHSPCGERICKVIQADGPLNSGTFQSLLWTELKEYTLSHRRDAQHLCSRVHDLHHCFSSLVFPPKSPLILKSANILEYSTAFCIFLLWFQ